MDHTYPHQNIIMYHTDSGGRTFVEDGEHDPKEDDVILFSGRHHMELPKEKRRVVSVGTIYNITEQKGIK